MFMYIFDSDKIDIAILFFICKNKTRKNREFYILNLSFFNFNICYHLFIGATVYP